MNPDIYPADQGFRMPAEWEPHTATWLTWPHNPETWPGQDMKDIEAVYIQMITALSGGETVHVLIHPDLAEPDPDLNIPYLFEANPNVKFHHIPTNDSWIRDYGPNFLVREKLSGQQEVSANVWKFDSWGAKYESELDDQAGSRIMDILNKPYFEPGIVLEGGAIEVNGQGVCLTTEQCLLNPNRNGGLMKPEMESWLRRYLGVRDIIWCQGNISGDDTDGHIDNLVRFVSSDTVLCAWEEDPTDPNHACLKENIQLLQSWRGPSGKPLNIQKLPMPGPIAGPEGRLPASYANFYIGNRVVLLPTYNHPNDKVAETALTSCFPNRKVVGVPSEQLIGGLGGVHCLTQQEPKGI